MNRTIVYPSDITITYFRMISRSFRVTDTNVLSAKKG